MGKAQLIRRVLQRAVPRDRLEDTKRIQIWQFQ